MQKLRPTNASEAHDRYAEFSPDLFDRSSGGAVAAADVQWLYARGQFELAVLHRLVRDGYAVNRFVEYADNLGSAEPNLRFRTRLLPGKQNLRLRSDSRMSLTIDKAPLQLEASDDGWVLVSIPDVPSVLEVEVAAAKGMAATFGVDAVSANAWDVKTPTGQWEEAQSRSGGVEPPHAQFDGVPMTKRLRPSAVAGVYELAAPVLGRVIVTTSSAAPVIVTGESLEEVTTPHVTESRHDLTLQPDGSWQSVHELGFRYVSVRNASNVEVHVVAVAEPVLNQGVFLTSDDDLNRIWATSAYTLRLCMRGLMIDGIKRDRMPWVGDQALTTLTNAYAFANPTVTRDSIVALGQVREGFVNGIADYSLWWIVNQRFYQLYYDDVSHLAREAPYIEAFVRNLERFSTDDGLFRPKAETAGFADAGPGSVFIDWGVTILPGKDSTALQVLWYWALKSAYELLTKAGHPSAQHWRERAGHTRATILRLAWDEQAGALREYAEPGSVVNPYPNFLGVLSGLLTADAHPRAAEVIRGGHLGTPFMTTFAIAALEKAGDVEGAMAHLRAKWLPMLQSGARSFWEDFAHDEDPNFAMYGRAFGKSLAHAWGAGPAALLPQIVLNVRPRTDGWREFTCDPRLGDLAWAAGVVPTPYGEIFISVDTGTATVQFPEGTSLVRDNDVVAGPRTVVWAVAPSEGAVAIA